MVAAPMLLKPRKRRQSRPGNDDRDHWSSSHSPRSPISTNNYESNVTAPSVGAEDCPKFQVGGRDDEENVLFDWLDPLSDPPTEETPSANPEPRTGTPTTTPRERPKIARQGLLHAEGMRRFLQSPPKSSLVNVNATRRTGRFDVFSVVEELRRLKSGFYKERTARKPDCDPNREGLFTLYKPKGVKIEPLNSDAKDGEIPVLHRDWKTEAYRRVKPFVSRWGPPKYEHLLHPRFSPFAPGTRATPERISAMDVGTSMTKEERALFDAMVIAREGAFAWGFEHLGKVEDYVAAPQKIRTVPHQAWQYPAIRMAPSIREELMKMLGDRMNAGTIEWSAAPYRNRFFAVKKKSGGLRMIVDCQTVNGNTIRDANPPPNPDEFSERFAGKRMLSLVDLFSGYDQLPLAEESRDITSFYSPIGLVRMTRVPQGGTNSVAQFQRVMRHILAEHFPKDCDVYIDDIVVDGAPAGEGDEEIEPGLRRFVVEHIQRLDRILTDIELSGTTIAGGKSAFCKDSALMVGYECSEEGRRPGMAKVIKILEWDVFESKRSVRGFVGVCVYFRIWIKGFAVLAEPLYRLLREDVEFIIEDEQIKAIETLKAALTNPPVLITIQYGPNAGMIIVYVDASGKGWGAVLVQVCKDGKERPARYESGMWSTSEMNYDSGKQEARALLHALKRFRWWLYGVHFTVRTDCSVVVAQLKRGTIDTAGVLMARWLTLLKLWDFDIEHIAGKKNVVADSLSRRPQGPNENENWDVEHDELDAFIDKSFNSLRLLTAQEEELNVWWSKQTPLEPRHKTRTSTGVRWVRDDRDTLKRTECVSSRRRDSSFVRQPRGAEEEETKDGGRSLGLRRRGVMTGSKTPNIALSQFGTEPHAQATESEPNDDLNQMRKEGGQSQPEGAHDAARSRQDPEGRIAQSPRSGQRLSRSSVKPKSKNDLKPHGVSEPKILARKPTTRKSRISPSIFETPLTSYLLAPVHREEEPEEADREAQTEDESIRQTMEEPLPADIYSKESQQIARFLLFQKRPTDLKGKEFRRFLRKVKRFVVTERHLFRLASKNIPLRRVVDTTDERNRIIKALHDESGHKGREGTYRRVADRYYWDQMWGSIKDYVKSCPECQQRAPERKEEALHPTWQSILGRRWYVDVIHMPKAGHMRYLVVAREAVTGWVEARALRRATAQKVAEFLYEDVFSRHGCPVEIVFDGGPENMGETELTLELMGITRISISVYHPQANGMVERGHRVLKDALSKMTKGGKTAWTKHIFAVLWADRTTVRQPTGRTPAELLYGRQVILPIDISVPTWQVLPWNKIHTTEELLALRARQIERRDADLEEAVLRVRRWREKNKESFDDVHDTREEGDLKEDELVLLRDQKESADLGNKLAFRWKGPYRIIRANPERGSYRLAELDGSELSGTQAGNNLKRFWQREAYETDEEDHWGPEHQAHYESVEDEAFIQAASSSEDDNDTAQESDHLLTGPQRPAARQRDLPEDQPRPAREVITRYRSPEVMIPRPARRRSPQVIIPPPQRRREDADSSDSGYL